MVIVNILDIKIFYNSLLLLFSHYSNILVLDLLNSFFLPFFPILPFLFLHYYLKYPDNISLRVEYSNWLYDFPSVLFYI